jgi:hypothetical protein
VIGGENRYSISKALAWIREIKEIVARAPLTGWNICTWLVRKRAGCQADRPGEHSSELQTVADAI